jgi:PNKP adenylyltransferase domain, ligase domain
MTSRGGEGMVVKPLTFIAEGRQGITQPAIKCRGQSISESSMDRNTCYLRILNGCARGTLGQSALSRAGSSLWVSKRWSALSEESAAAHT